MEPLFEHRPVFGGVTTRALELEGEGPPILLIHGYADSADTWRLLLDRLAHANRRALALDLPGFGEADPLDRKRPMLEQFLDVTSAAVRQLAEESGERVYVAGNSMGGVVSLLLAEQPDLPLAGVMPIGPAGFDHPSWFQLILAQPAIRFVLHSPVPPPQAVVKPIMGQVFRQLALASPAPPGVLENFSRHNCSQRDLRRLLIIGKRLIGEIADGKAFHLEDISVPVTLVWGDRDRMVSHKGSRHLLEVWPQTRYELMVGIGHCPQIEVPDRVCSLLLEVTGSAARQAA